MPLLAARLRRAPRTPPESPEQQSTLAAAPRACSGGGYCEGAERHGPSSVTGWLMWCHRYSIGSKPLQIWDKKVMNGHIKRITDNDIQSSVLEIMSTNISTTFITCPADPQKTLGIKLPFLVMIIKNVRRLQPRAPGLRPRAA